MTALELKSPIDCPCCQQKVRAPTLDIVIDRYGVTPTEARILTAVWKGKGMPVSTERVFDAMYADDPDGGPSETAMYRAFKVALCRLRKRLRGAGIGIENCGYRQGYRLVLGREPSLRAHVSDGAKRRDRSDRNFEVRNATCS